jgi:hypothetical protein
MPVQQQMSNFANRLGRRVSEANAKHKDAPVDTGNRRLPPGIRNGIARLSAMYTKEQTEEGGKTPKGESFFRASAVILSPVEHNGEKIAGLTTSVIIPLCDVPAKGQRKAESFEDNWYEFQNIFKLLGVAPCSETGETDPTGQKTFAYFMAAMKTLTDPARMKTNPVYISFSTRGWTPPPNQQQPKPEEIVFETWHGLAQWNGQVDPAAGIKEQPAPTQSTPTSPPPPTDRQSPSTTPTTPSAPPPSSTSSTATAGVTGLEVDADYVSSLVETAMADPEGTTEEAVDAGRALEELAWAAGWTEQQTSDAADWAAVGAMALNSPTSPSQTPSTATTQSTNSLTPTSPTVGTRWMFAKRGRDGNKLKNNKGEEFPPQEVEVVTVDADAKTCTVKTVRDGKDVVDIRTKKPVDVKFEWLERLPY